MKHQHRQTRLFNQLTAALLILALAAVMLSACSTEETEEIIYADFGTTGSDFATDYAKDYPNRSPGSDQEKAAADFLTSSLEALGYDPQVIPFEFTDSDGALHESQNIIVTIAGSGFERPDEDGQTTSFERQVIVGAHYDAPVTAEASEAAAAAQETGEGGETVEKNQSLADFDGIQDNAAAVAALLTIARQAKSYAFGYDVILVLFGAGSADYAGARAYAESMDTDDILATDAMYCMTGIYAGDKVYAHAGRNSIVGEDQKDYEMRRKLYETTDVFYEHRLYTNNRYMLYTNQSGIFIEFGEGEETNRVLYREWTLNESDYTPFDNLGIPIVYFETYNYDEKSVDSMSESENPAFGSTNGQISGTLFDSSDYLAEIFKTSTAGTGSDSDDDKPAEDLLTKRINNTAFLILEAIRKGVHDATAK